MPAVKPSPSAPSPPAPASPRPGRAEMPQSATAVAVLSPQRVTAYFGIAGPTAVAWASAPPRAAPPGVPSPPCPACGAHDLHITWTGDGGPGGAPAGTTNGPPDDRSPAPRPERRADHRPGLCRGTAAGSSRLGRRRPRHRLASAAARPPGPEGPPPDLGRDRIHPGERATSAGCTGRLLAPDGRYEHAPLRLADVDQADIDALAAGAAVFGRPHAPAHVRQALEDGAGLAYHDSGDHARTRLVMTAAQLAGLLDLAPDRDSELLAALVEGQAEAGIILTPDGEAAYQRYVTRAHRMWTLSDPLARYLY